MPKPRLSDHFAVGDALYGYCDGYFGRDSYGEKRVEAVGSDWMIVREGGEPRALLGVPHGLDAALVDRWRTEPDEDAG